jgi:N-acetylneuraminic acid mutarotase
LVFGGQVDTTSADLKLGEIRPNQAELYDPATGKFSLTGKMNTIRVEHTTTLLPDGRVLIIGGSMGLISKDEIEVYDPKTGQFSIVGKLKKARERHQATLLKDGQVLITGGDEESHWDTKYTIHDTAEIFDPKTNQSILLSSRMHYSRHSHTAILLPDGKVLIMDGFRQKGPKSPSREVELYDPKTKKFTLKTGLILPRIGRLPALLLPNGMVLIAGGGSGNIEGGHPLLAEAELYNPKKDHFTAISPMNFERGSPQFVQLENGKVLVIGGEMPQRYKKQEALELYNPETQSFEYIGDILRRWYRPAVIALPSRKVLIVGRATTAENSVNAALYVY